MVDFPTIFIALNVLVPGSFWGLYLLKARDRRPVKISWFWGRLLFAHLLSGLMIYLWTFDEDPIEIVFNFICWGIIFFKCYPEPVAILISDEWYAVIVGRILFRKENLPTFTRKSNFFGSSSGGSSSSWSSSSDSFSSSSDGGSSGGGGASGDW